MRFKNISNIILYCFLVIFGVIIRGLFNYKVEYFEFEKSINLIDVLSFFMTFFLAYIVYAVLDKDKEVRVKEKELINNRVQEIYDFVQAFNLNLDGGNIAYVDTTAMLKRLHRHFINIDKILKLAELECPEGHRKDLIVLTRELRDLMTTTLTTSQVASNIQAQIPIPVEIINGIIKYSNIRSNEILIKFDDLKNKIIVFQLELNKL